MLPRSFVGFAISIGVAVSAPGAALALGPGGWDNVGGGLNDVVFELNTDAPGQLLVGGRFTNAGGNPNADEIASWNGTSWSAFGPSDSLMGTSTFVNAIAYDNGKIYAGGTFGDGVGPAIDNLAVWNGATWQPFCATVGGPVDALEVIGSTLYVGGAFNNVNGVSAADNLIKCDLTTGSFIGATVDNDGDLGGRVQALVAVGTDLYAGGDFINTDLIQQADYVAKYNGSSWSAMGSGPGGPPAPAINTANVDALATDGTNVYVGTDDDDVAGIPQADHVARWNGSSWSAVGASTGGGDGYFPAGGLTQINGLVAAGSNLYATGSFNNANGDLLADHIAIFNGTSWSHLGSNAAGDNGPFTGNGNALAFFNGAPVLGGNFTDTGGDPLADRIATFPAPPAPPPPPPITPPAAVPPTAVLEKMPKKKVVTDKSKAKVTFTFASDTAASFLCRLDNKAFAACTSPKKLKVKPGKHTFEVEGADASGTAGAPASFKFKVVHKK